MQAQRLYSHAQLCRAAIDGKMPEIWEAFPYWTEEEIKEIRLERIWRSLRLHTKKGG